MPIDPELLQILRSPGTGFPLRRAEQAELDEVNRLVAAGQARNRAGEAVDEPLDQGLVSEEESVVFPIRDDIPILLKHAAIPFVLRRSDEARG